MDEIKIKSALNPITTNIVLLLFIFIALRAFYSPSFKYLTGVMHPFAIDMWLGVISLLVFGFLAGWQLPSLAKLGDRKLDFFFKSALALAGGILLDLSIFYLPIKAFALLVSLIPVVVAFYSVIILKEKPTLKLWLAILFAVIGSIIFKFGEKLFAGQAITFAIGDFAVVVGVLLFSLMPITSRQYVSLIGGRQLILLQDIVSVTILVLINFIFGTFALLPTGTKNLFTFLVIAVITVGSALASSQIAKRVPAHTFVTMTTALIPIGAVILGIIIFSETLNLSEIIGGVIMISAGVLAGSSGTLDAGAYKSKNNSIFLKH